MESNKEIKEVLVGLNAVSLLMVKLLKDGVQLADGVELVSALLSNEELKAAVGNAIDGISKVPAELKDLDLAEGLELASLEISFVPALVSALKG